jgi:hypothetical protein
MIGGNDLELLMGLIRDYQQKATIAPRAMKSDSRHAVSWACEFPPKTNFGGSGQRAEEMIKNQGHPHPPPLLKVLRGAGFARAPSQGPEAKDLKYQNLQNNGLNGRMIRLYAVRPLRP